MGDFMNQIIYEFVKNFFPEHKRFWENLSNEEMAFLNTIPHWENDLKQVIFFPEENIEMVEKFRDKTKDLKIIIDHRECVFDYFLYRKLSTYRGSYFESKYNFIFAEPEKYSAQIKELKTINGYMNKIYDVIPSVYKEHEKEKRSRQEAVFGRFYQHIDSVTYKSNYECINFKRSQMNLIPYFLEYRNSHLVEWAMKFYLQEQEQMRNYRTPVTVRYEFNGLQSKVYTVESYLKTMIEKRIYALLNKYKYDCPEIEFEYDYFSVRYSSKNSLFGANNTIKIHIKNFEEELEKFEMALAG